MVCSTRQQFPTLDKVEGGFVKLTKDDHDEHHWIPMDWIDHVDRQVHVNRPGDRANGSG